MSPFYPFSDIDLRGIMLMVSARRLCALSKVT